MKYNNIGFSITKMAARVCAMAGLAIVSLANSASAELLYGVAAVGNATALVTFDSATPANLQSGTFISGLQTNETLVGIDFRPATGQLFGLGTSSRLYTIDISSGAATAVGGQFAPPLNGFSFGFDFNPAIDRIRVVAETNKNYVINPDTGAVQLVATDLAYGIGDPNFGRDPNVIDSAYTNNFPNAQATQLYGIDTGLDILVTQANNAGTLNTVGPLGFNAAALGGFDISGTTGVAYAAILPAGSSQSNLYRINLATGAAVLIDQIDGGLILTALTVAPVIPEPATIALAATGLVGVVALRRRRK